MKKTKDTEPLSFGDFLKLHTYAQALARYNPKSRMKNPAPHPGPKPKLGKR